MTELGTAVFFDLPEPEEREKVARLLARTVEDNHFRADFGILGAKYVPRALSGNGYIDHAFRLFTQEEYPGWGYWVKEGASALWEHWDGTHSRAHIMFGDLNDPNSIVRRVLAKNFSIRRKPDLGTDPGVYYII